MPHRSPLKSALPLVVVLTLVWGTTWVLFPYAVKEVSVWTFRAVSMTCAGLSLLAFAAMRGLPLSIPRTSWSAQRWSIWSSGTSPARLPPC